MKLATAQPMAIQHNVSINVIDERTGQIVHHHEGHNTATNSMLTGIAKFLTGESVFNQGYAMIHDYIPQYISLGTLGLHSQDQDAEGLPTGIGPDDPSLTEEERYSMFMAQRPGFGADGYNINLNNNRAVFGLGYPYTSYRTNVPYTAGDICMYQGAMYRCIYGAYGSWNPSRWELMSGPDIPDASGPHFGELITPTFPRVKIAYREIVPEHYSELPCTLDVIYSAMISTGALRQFRYQDNDYVFITEAGLWSRQNWDNSGANGLIAGYRVAPPNKDNWDMSVAANRKILQRNVIRVGTNQVVQVTWKIQIGSIEEFGGLSDFYEKYYDIQWEYGG